MTYFNPKENKELFRSKRSTVIFLSLLAVAFILAFWFQGRRDEKLEHTIETTGILVKKFRTSHSGGVLKYHVGDKTYETTIWGANFDENSVGDTIMIKYAVDDPELLRIVRECR